MNRKALSGRGSHIAERIPCQVEKERCYRELAVTMARCRIGRKVLLTIMTRQFFPVEDLGHLHRRHPEVLAVFGEPRRMAPNTGARGHPSRRRASARLLRMTDECVHARV